MKKIMLLIGIICLIFTSCANDESNANREKKLEQFTIEGVVTEVLDGQVMLKTDEGIFVVYSKETDKVQRGDRVTYEYSGEIMESDPPQIEATQLIKVSLPTLSGEVKSIDDNQLTLSTDKGDYIVHLNKDVVYDFGGKIEQGDHLTVTFSGLVMESMPPQINALEVSGGSSQ